MLGFLFTARILALELTTRPLEARGMTRVERRAALRTRSPRVLGFGVGVQLCFLVPGGAILVMPAAVAGATHLARHVIGGVDAQVFAEEPAPVRPAPLGPGLLLQAPELRLPVLGRVPALRRAPSRRAAPRPGP